MAKNNELRPQEIKPEAWYKKAAFPWIIILVIAIAGAAFVAGWTVRSSYVVTPAEVHAQVLEQLASKK